MDRDNQERRVVVLGAGYAGLPAARRLARQVHRYGVRVILVNAEPTFVERPRLHQVATGQRVPELPLRDLLAGSPVELVVGLVTAIDLDRREVRVDTADGELTIGYHTLGHGLGSTIDRDSVPGVRANAHTLADPASAIRLRDEAARFAVSGGTALVCGGGLTGIEAAAELAESYPGLRVWLAGRGVPGGFLSAGARGYLDRALRRLGVEVVAGAEITEVRDRAGALAGRADLPFDLCLWAGGFTVPALARDSGLAVNSGGRRRPGRLLDVLAPDVTLITDGGGKIRAPRRPIVGADKVARFLAAGVGNIPAGTRLHFVDINGEPGAVTAVGSVPYAVFVLEVDPETGRVATIRLIGNPDKLAGLAPLP